MPGTVILRSKGNVAVNANSTAPRSLDRVLPVESAARTLVLEFRSSYALTCGCCNCLAVPTITTFGTVSYCTDRGHTTITCRVATNLGALILRAILAGTCTLDAVLDTVA